MRIFFTEICVCVCIFYPPSHRETWSKREVTIHERGTAGLGSRMEANYIHIIHLYSAIFFIAPEKCEFHALHRHQHDH